MFFLVLVIILMSVFSLGYKAANHQGCNLIAVNLSRNFVGLLAVAVIIICFDSFRTEPEVIGISVLAGVSIFIAVLSFFYVVRTGELSISWTIISLSLVIPLFASIFIWKEMPSFRQIIGIALVLASFFSFASLKGGRSRLLGRWWLLVLVSFFFTGVSMVCSKMLIESNLTGEKLVYIFYINLWIFILSAILLLIKGYFPSRRDFLIGTLMALSGSLGFFLFLVALENVPGVVAFPVRGTGSLVLTTLLSVLIWKERIGIKGTVGIIFAVLAILLISI